MINNNNNKHNIIHNSNTNKNNNNSNNNNIMPGLYCTFSILICSSVLYKLLQRLTFM